MIAKRQQLTLLFLIVCSITFGQKPMLVKAVARPGDGVYSMLRFYNLEKQKCNIDLFYVINGMDPKSYLKTNNVYYLPLYSYAYDGKSIRSSIGNNDMATAKRIQAFNELMVTKKMRAKGYQDSKILWVPNHELGCKGVPTADGPIAVTPAVNPPTVATKPIETTTQPETKPDKPTTSSDKPNLGTEATINSGKVVILDPKSRIFPVFGKKFEEVPLVDNKLKGSIYYIVSGHGGPDPGAIGKSTTGKTLCEDEYAYDVSLRLARNLIRRGATVYVITRDPNDGIRTGSILECDKDEQCWPKQVIPLNAKKRLEQRSNSINKLYEYYKSQGVTNQTAVMVHVDSRSVKERVDLFFYHFPESKSGKKLATTLFGTMEHQYKKNRPSGQYEGTVSARDLFMLRETKPTAVYVEMGNIQNRNDQKRFTEEGNRQALANWLGLGLLKAASKK